ncbi:tetratricopeptide repeat protein, partial [Methylobacterium sp. CG08_land_8_20_14_0_20_71_15]
APSRQAAEKAQTSGEAGAETKAEDGRPPIADPQTTQAITEGQQFKPAAKAAGALPAVAGMQTLSGDLAGLPPGLATLKQSALAGDGAAVFELAVRAADARGMPRDLGLAAKLYEKLAQANYAPAQYRLAGQYEKGSGVARDLAQAKLWYGRAAEQGHARSMHNLAVIYAENPGPNGKPDFASAASWFRQAAEYGVRDSQYNLAVLYARGLGLSQDLVQSYAWFAASAAQGDTEGGRKRDDVAGKLGAEDLAKAKAIVSGFKPRKADPAVNEPPAQKEAPMSLIGAPAPSASLSSFTPAPKRAI